MLVKAAASPAVELLWDPFEPASVVVAPGVRGSLEVEEVPAIELGVETDADELKIEAEVLPCDPVAVP